MDARKDEAMSLYAIGIDPGSSTGFAVWNVTAQKFEAIATCEHVTALFLVRPRDTKTTLIVFEDARKRQWFGSSGREKLQGAGSIKARSADWEQFCKMFDYRFRAVSPQSVKSIDDPAMFKRVTGYTGRTSVHSRDAAMLVFGMTEANWRDVK